MTSVNTGKTYIYIKRLTLEEIYNTKTIHFIQLTGPRWKSCSNWETQSRYIQELITTKLHQIQPEASNPKDNLFRALDSEIMYPL